MLSSPSMAQLRFPARPAVPTLARNPRLSDWKAPRRLLVSVASQQALIDD